MQLFPFLNNVSNKRKHIFESRNCKDQQLNAFEGKSQFIVRNL